MVADALDRLGHEHDLERRADRARVFHHVADELAHDRGERGVDLLVEVDHFGGRDDVEPRERVERELQRLPRPRGCAAYVEVPDLRESLVLHRVRRATRDLLHLVADPLEIVHDLGDGQDHAQVDRSRLTPGDDHAALLVHVDLHLVDHLLVGADRVEHRVAFLLALEKLDRARELRLDDAAHRQDAAPDRLHVGVELLVRVLGHVSLPRGAAGVSRSAR